MPQYHGSCHCGAVRFRIDAAITELTTCDCSLCVKKNALMAKVHESQLTVLQGEDALSLYQWNTHRAKHYFCSRCGIYTFHRKRAAPDHYGVNVFCLDDFDPHDVPVRATEGVGMTVVDPAARPEWPGPRVAGEGG
ncbi:GFA family protein [Crenobacter sp. SG2303]|uniref:GFA family protein n=1 Tax=Crenobacter oryzisoli TaxID=3056844 RepID=A0ABT7XKW0_9NEIS|nr:GFA family protein [Crenobacter sp. SG2303]MDN0074415.1 GFA family protein [Crenobacter sp. SG2303]